MLALTEEGWVIFAVVAGIALVVAFFMQIDSDTNLVGRISEWRGKMPSMCESAADKSVVAGWVAEGEKLAAECDLKTIGNKSWVHNANNVRADIRAVIT